MKKIQFYSLVIAACVAVSSANAEKTPIPTPQVQTIGGPVTPYKFTGSLKDLPLAKKWQPGDPIKQIPRRTYGHQPINPVNYSMSKDLLAELQKQTQPVEPSAFGNTIINIDGQGFTGVNPPDTTGDIGKLYYIQSINGSGGSEFTIYNKTTGAIEAGPILMESLAPSSSACASGSGDPIVLYDEVVQRWFLQEFVTGANKLCFYISATDDPINGGWNFYEYTGATFPDYPHFGIWSDAYYGTANENPATVYAFDRVNMIAGTVARPAQAISLGDLPGYGFQTGTPVDWDGTTPPPAGTPGIIMRHVDEEAHSSFPNNAATDLLEMWAFQVDFDNAANSSFTQMPNITISDFNSYFLDYSTFATVPQPGGSARLDAIREVILNRLQYRNMGSYEMILGVLPTNIDPSTTGSTVNAGLRWFELRKTGASAWSLYQEGTYDVGVSTQNRLVGSPSMDESGNIALAYTLTDVDSANPVSASVAYTGRLSNDSLDVMTQPEVISKVGSGIQTSGRWGDYASMGVDPIDGCTFWFTAEYQNGSSWNTSITSFKFDQCGCLLTLNPINVTAANANAANSIQVSWDDSSEPTMIEYRVFRTTTPGTGYVQIGTVTDTSPGAGNSGSYSFNDVSVSAGTTYYYIVRASDGVSCLTPESNEVSAVATGVCTLAPVFAGLSNATNAAISQCTNNLTWAAGTSQCPNGAGTINYSVYRSTTSAFTPNPSNQIATGLSGLTYSDMDSNLVSGTEYFYIVRAEDLDNNLEDDNTVTFASTPTGTIVPSVFSEDLEGYANIAAAEAAGWVRMQASGTEVWDLISGDDNTTGTGNSFVSSDVPTATDKSIATMEFTPTASSVVSFFHKFDFENNWDGGRIEITTDGGSNWVDLGGAITSGAYTGNLSGGSGDAAWTGNSGAAFSEVTVDLSGYASQVVQIRWRSTTDSSVGAGDWKVDDINISNVGTFGVCTSISPASILLTKTATLTTDTGYIGEADLNDVITFSVSVENTGGVALDTLVVNDSMAGVLTCAPTTLAPGAIATCTDYTYTVLQTDIDAGGSIDNTATATMTNPVDATTYNSAASTQTAINQAFFKDGFE